MPFNNVCFVSYRHPGHRFGREIVETFCDVLEGHVDRLMSGRKVYVDRPRLKPGYLFNDALAHELCQSACMVVLFNPSYFDLSHTYCAREYQAMVALERQRLARLRSGGNGTMGMIIPVIISGEEDLPAELSANRQHVSLEKEILRATDLRRKVAPMQKIRDIAQQVYQVCKVLETIDDICKGCDGFALPTDSQIKPWLQTVLAPPQAQPGRSA